MMHPPQNNLTPVEADIEIPEEMKDEIAAAAKFLTKMVDTPSVTALLPKFKQSLTKRLVDLYQGHWYSDEPSRGQAYRCIEICDSKTNKMLENTAIDCGLSYSQLRLPNELIVWIDPHDVACRFGEELGSFLPIFMNNNGKKDCYIDHFDFTRLCERRKPHTIQNGLRSNHETPPNNRVIYSSSDLMEVEVERALPQSANLLTPPTTPPPQSPSVISSSSVSSQSTSANTPSTNSSSVSSSSPPSSTSVYMNKHQHFFRNNNGKVQPPSYLNLNANAVSTSSNSNHYNYINSTRSSPASPSLLMFPSSPNSNRNSFNNYNVYGGGSANSPNMFGGQGSYGRSPPRAGNVLNGNTNMMNGSSAGGKLSSKWGPYNFPSSNPGGYPPYHSSFYNAPLQRYNNNNNANTNGNANNDRNLYINQRGLRA